MIDIKGGIRGASAVGPADPVRPVQRQQAQQGETESAVSKKAADAVETVMRAVSPPLMGQNERLSISRDETTGTFIYRSIDRESGEVVRQWPVESMLQFKAYLRHTEGVLIDSKV